MNIASAYCYIKNTLPTSSPELSLFFTKKRLNTILLFLLLFLFSCSDKSCIEANDFGEYEQIFENEEDRDKPKFAFWGGNEEVSDLIRKVYNNQFDELPFTLRKQLEKISFTKNPSGIGALCKISEYSLDSSKNGKWLYLDEISDPGN